MDEDFWRQRWQENDIGFHQSETNPALIKYFKRLSLAKGSRVFVPLCGKSLDIAWLLAEGYCVVGVELVANAIEQLFIGLGVEPKISKVGNLERYSANNIELFSGNIFDLSSDILGPVDAVYDRAALVALDNDLRKRYSAHLIKLTNKAPQLLLICEYDQSLMEGPPFSISEEEVKLHYQLNYNLTLVASAEIVGGLKGKCEATEHVWLLQNN